MPDPIVRLGVSAERLVADGESFSILEWNGSGPPVLHVHNADDEAWHVLEGVLSFRFGDGRVVEAGPGSSVFVPAGVPHTYVADEARYLVVLTPRLRALIQELQSPESRGREDEVYRKYDSVLME